MIKLSIAEISQVLTLLSLNEQEEFYYGNKDYYWRRHARIVEELEKESIRISANKKSKK